MAFQRVRRFLGAILLIFGVSFAVTDYSLRGHLYYTKRAVNDIVGSTWQAVFPPSGPVHLYVRVAADQAYRAAHPDWKPRLYDLVAAVSARFEEEFGIRFSVLSVEAWNRPSGLNSYEGILTHAERKLNRRSSQILVVMTAPDKDYRRTDRWIDVGAAHYLGNCVVVGEDRLLRHEIGHLFGAVDYPPGSRGFDLESIYSYKYADRSDAIDPANEARILKHKYRWLW
jgi:hypothetical protein